MAMRTSVRRATTVSAATLALVLSGGGLAFAATLPGPVDTAVTTETGTVTSTTGSLLPTTAPTPTPSPTSSGGGTVPLPAPLPSALPLPTTAPAPVPTVAPTQAPAPAGQPKTGGSGVSAPKLPTHHAARHAAAPAPDGSADVPGGGYTGAAYDGALPTFDLPAATAALMKRDAGAQPLVAGAPVAPIVVQHAASDSPAASGPVDAQRAAGIAVVIAVVAAGAVAAAHLNLLQRRFALSGRLLPLG